MKTVYSVTSMNHNRKKLLKGTKSANSLGHSSFRNKGAWFVSHNPNIASIPKSWLIAYWNKFLDLLRKTSGKWRRKHMLSKTKIRVKNKKIFKKTKKTWGTNFFIIFNTYLQQFLIASLSRYGSSHLSPGSQPRFINLNKQIKLHNITVNVKTWDLNFMLVQ